MFGIQKYAICYKNSNKIHFFDFKLLKSKVVQ